MFAFFLESPIQLMFLLVVLLLLFGPQKLPEIGQQLGRALRELKRTTQELSNSIHLDDHDHTPYDPPRYDNYETRYDDYTPSSSSDNTWESPAPESKAYGALAAPEPPRGDFAAAALSDASEDYGVYTNASEMEARTPASSAPDVGPNPEGTVARGKAEGVKG